MGRSKLSWRQCDDLIAGMGISGEQWRTVGRGKGAAFNGS